MSIKSFDYKLILNKFQNKFLTLKKNFGAKLNLQIKLLLSKMLVKLTTGLKMHREYSQSNCLLECVILFAQSELKKLKNTTCTPWSLFEPFSYASKKLDRL